MGIMSPVLPTECGEHHRAQHRESGAQPVPGAAEPLLLPMAIGLNGRSVRGRFLLVLVYFFTFELLSFTFLLDY